MMLPEAVGIGMARPDAHPLMAGEEIVAAPSRLAEYAGGRLAARRAMAGIGLPPVAIPMGTDRAPVWPDGLAGSITHSGGVCLAAVSTGAMLGIDLEQDRPLDADSAAIVLLPEEDATFSAMIFSAKEAVYKAQYPLTRTLFGFDTLAVTMADGSFAARFRRAVGCFDKGAVVRGRYARVGGQVLTVVYAGSGLRI